jgi:hypothetical protein
VAFNWRAPNLPDGGIESLSTTIAVYPIAAPLDGAKVTVNLQSFTHTTTAAAYYATNVDSGSLKLLRLELALKLRARTGL